EPLNMVPVKVRQGQKHSPDLLVATGNQFLAQMPNATARVEDRDLTELALHHDTGRIAAEVLEFAVADRNGATRAVKLHFDAHAISPNNNATNIAFQG